MPEITESIGLRKNFNKILLDWLQNLLYAKTKRRSPKPRQNKMTTTYANIAGFHLHEILA